MTKEFKQEMIKTRKSGTNKKFLEKLAISSHKKEVKKIKILICHVEILEVWKDSKLHFAPFKHF